MCIDYIIACAGCHAPELIAATKFKTTKINFGGLFGLSTKIICYTVWHFEPHPPIALIRGRGLGDFEVRSLLSSTLYWFEI